MEIEPFTENHVDEAASILASSFQRFRKKTFLLRYLSSLSKQKFILTIFCKMGH